MKVFNLCAKVTKRHLVSLGVYLGIFAVLAVMLTAFNNTSQSLSFEAVRPSAAIVNRDGESALVRGLEDFLAGYADMVKLEDDREALQDARFFDAVDYILIIPQGFAKGLFPGRRHSGEKYPVYLGRGALRRSAGEPVFKRRQSVPAGGAGAV